MSYKIPLAGVVGHPVAHSKSPILHGHWLRRYNLPGHYVPLDIVHDDLARAFEILPRIGFKGVNVTIPHKEAALRLATTVTDRAALIGATNTITFRPDGSIHADNTDGYGFLTNLQENAPAWVPEQGRAVVLGAGGAARAIVAALLGAGVPEILLANRTRARAEMLAEQFGARVKPIDWTRLGEFLPDCGLLVNTTSLGMVGHPPLELSLRHLDRGAVVTDLVYTPLETGLLAAARERGNVAVDGLGMLLHQAAPGFEHWFGQKPEVDETLRRAVLGPEA